VKNRGRRSPGPNLEVPDPVPLIPPSEIARQAGIPRVEAQRLTDLYGDVVLKRRPKVVRFSEDAWERFLRHGIGWSFWRASAGSDWARPRRTGTAICGTGS